MRDTDAVMRIIRDVVKKSPADQLEVTVSLKDYGLTRFAGNEIHQNMAEEDSSLTVRVYHNSRIGSCSTNILDKGSILKAVDTAMEIASLNNEDTAFPGFAEREKVEDLQESPYVETTARTGVEERGDITDSLLSAVEKRGFEAAGAVASESSFMAVCTSRGQEVAQKETSASLNMVVNRPGQAGFGTGSVRWLGRDIGQLNAAGIADKAVDISERNHDPVSVEPGEYEVILTPEAVGLLLYYLSWMGFHSRAFHSGQSFMAGRIGEPVLDPKLTIIDDAFDCRGFAIPFDWEGRPKQRVNIIENGAARDVVYDSVTGAAAGRRSTGHALSLLRDRYYSSPLPTNLFIDTGDTDIGEMIRSTEKAIFINRFWYVREVHWGRAAVTGMTRDGTFLVEHGKITKALHNLRFTQSIVEAFSNVISIGKDAVLTEQFNGVAMVPALRLGRFNIVGSSKF